MELTVFRQIQRLWNMTTGSLQQELLDKHYLRKHGKNAYYGQN